jgi:hypothetical protein
MAGSNVRISRDPRVVVERLTTACGPSNSDIEVARSSDELGRRWHHPVVGLSRACPVLTLVLVTLAVVLHILIPLVATFDVVDVNHERKEVVRMKAARWLVRGFIASALVTADVLTNVAVIAGSG